MGGNPLSYTDPLGLAKVLPGPFPFPVPQNTPWEPPNPEDDLTRGPAPSLPSIPTISVPPSTATFLCALSPMLCHVINSQREDQACSASGNEKKKIPKPGVGGKEGAKDVPSWAKGERPNVGESGKDFADRLLGERYGKGNYDKGPNSEHNKVRKWGDRSFIDPK